MVRKDSILVTGTAGFIGYHVARKLVEQGRRVVGLDNINAYYDPALKEARLRQLAPYKAFEFIKLDLTNREGLAALFARHRFGSVVHLAAQVGVRYSLIDPHAYVDSNLQGFVNVLEGCRHYGCGHLVYASSSSVYGANCTQPYSVHQSVDHPFSLYAATKKANELMAHSYSHLYSLPTTGLRFFTVYGPWGRPDMAVYSFASAIVAGRPVRLFNHGKMRRDFTFIDDVTEAVVRLVDRPPQPNTACGRPSPATSAAPWRVYNIGNSRPIDVPRVVDLIEGELGRVAIREMVAMQPGDVLETAADVDDLIREIDFRPETDIDYGIRQFIAWFREYHR